MASLWELDSWPIGMQLSDMFSLEEAQVSLVICSQLRVAVGALPAENCGFRFSLILGWKTAISCIFPFLLFDWFASERLGPFFSPLISQFVKGVDNPAPLAVTEDALLVKETHAPSADFAFLEARQTPLPTSQY